MRLEMLFLSSARMVRSTSSGLSSTSRMVWSLMGLASFEGETEHGALPGLAFGPGAAAVQRRDPGHGGEADAGAGELGFGVQALERAEELVGVLHLEAGAVVAHAEGGGAGVFLGEDLDAGRGGLGGELPGVADEVVQHDLHEAAVGVVPHAGLDA